MQEENTNQEAVLETPQGDEAPNEDNSGEETPEVKEGKKDPLDDIEDIDKLRAEAKGYRSIANRLSKKGEQPSEPAAPTPAPTTDFVTKKDLEDRAEKSAIKLMTGSSDDDNDAVKTMKQAIADNWNDISTYYVNRNGREEPEQIAKDIRSAYILWADEHGQEADISQLTNVAVLKGSTPKKTAPVVEEDPRFKPKPSPSEWYKTKKK